MVHTYRKEDLVALESEIDEAWVAFRKDWNKSPNVNEEFVNTIARCFKLIAHELDELRNEFDDEFGN
jgi:hypothetical protein